MVTRLILLFSAFAGSVIAQAPGFSTLNPGVPVKQEIRAGEVHRHYLQAPTGAFVRGTVRQDGIAVNVRGLFPDGTKIRSFAGPPTGTKNFRFVIENPGTYVLEITGQPGFATAGSYVLTLDQVQPLEERLSIKIPERYFSPRIQALEKDVLAGNKDALNQFWNRVSRDGTPMVEPLAGDTGGLLVTFLWRATFPISNVLVFWNPYATEHPEDFRMSRLRDTDVWYKTIRMPMGARFVYQLSANDTLTRSPNAQRFATAQADPLNPRRRPADPNITKYEAVSLAELPGASPQLWVERRADLPSGQLHQHRMVGQNLGNERAITVYAPPGFQKQGTPYPLLVLFDADTYQTDVPAPTILDNLIGEKKIAPTVAVLVNYPASGGREAELFGNLDFADFVSKELVPWMAREYNVATEPQRNVIGGLSAGGFAAAFIGLHHPEHFGNVLSQSGAFWWAPDLDKGAERNALAREYASSPRRNLRFFLEAGVFENDISGVGGQILEHNRHLRDVLRAKGYEVHYQEFPGGHDRLTWRGSLAEGLLSLVGVR
jgi:enterochelin esterase family protein